MFRGSTWLTHRQHRRAPTLCEGYRLEEQCPPQFHDLEATLLPRLPFVGTHVLLLIYLGFGDTVSLL